MPTAPWTQPGNVGQANIPIKSGQSLTTTQFSVFQNESTMETFLLANGYTEAMLVPLGTNDKIYACRVKMGLGAS